MNVALAQPLALHLEQAIRASRERVFDAWTQPEHIKQWSAPEGMTIPEAESDARVGGKLRVAMVEPNGTRHVFVGEYREINRPARVVYTHAWLLNNGASTETSPETIVTINFLSENGGTRVVMTQTGFESSESHDSHSEGWTSTLRRFAGLFQ